MGRIDRCYNIADLREVARNRLPKGVFEYLDKGTEDQVSLGTTTASGSTRPSSSTRFSWTSRTSGSTPRSSARPRLSAGDRAHRHRGLTWYEGEFELAKAAGKGACPSRWRPAPTRRWRKWRRNRARARGSSSTCGARRNCPTNSSSAREGRLRGAGVDGRYRPRRQSRTQPAQRLFHALQGELAQHRRHDAPSRMAGDRHGPLHAQWRDAGTRELSRAVSHQHTQGRRTQGAAASPPPCAQTRCRGRTWIACATSGRASSSSRASCGLTMRNWPCSTALTPSSCRTTAAATWIRARDHRRAAAHRRRRRRQDRSDRRLGRSSRQRHCEMLALARRRCSRAAQRFTARRRAVRRRGKSAGDPQERNEANHGLCRPAKNVGNHRDIIWRGD